MDKLSLVNSVILHHYYEYVNHNNDTRFGQALFKLIRESRNVCYSPKNVDFFCERGLAKAFAITYNAQPFSIRSVLAKAVQVGSYLVTWRMFTWLI